MHRSMSGALAGQRNALGFIRLVLAAAVIVSHAKPLGGFGDDPLTGITLGQTNLGRLAVAGFFAISGYVIVRSGSHGDGLQFLWRRAIRIFPAFWVVLLLTAFVLAPIAQLASGASLSALGSPADGSWHYVQSNWMLRIDAWGIADVFESTTPYGRQTGQSVVNGSLWTLGYEWLCYLLVLVFVVSGVLARAKALVPAMAGFFLVLQVVASVDPGLLARIAPFFADVQLVHLVFVFLVGGTIAAYGDRIPFSDSLGVLSGVVAVATLLAGGFLTIGVVAVAYFVLYLGARLPRSLQRIGAANDYSYGLYVYGFAVQQTLAALGAYRFGYLPFALLSLAVTLAFAYVSWHVIEKPALRLRNRGPGRGIAHWRARASVALRAASRQPVE